MEHQESVKLRSGNLLIPAVLIYRRKRIYIQVRYSPKLIEELKSMKGARWHGYEEPPIKMWSVDDCIRNRFQFEYLMNRNPYKRYDDPLIEHTTNRPLYKHQLEMVQHALTRHYCIFAAEMGTGKTLSAIELMEHVLKREESHQAWYVGPKSGVKAVQRELKKWDSKIIPRMLTYEGLVKILQKENILVPRIVIFDESSKLKTPTAKRSQAAMHLADAVREEWDDEGYVILMSGTPAPKTPVDWYNQCEVSCPGFLKEGDIHKFRRNLCIIEERESMAGGRYPHVVTWLDDADKCKRCGDKEDAIMHSQLAVLTGDGHRFEPSINEVARLYERMKGLVLVKFKRDCIDLPEKRYRVIKCKPTPEAIRASKLITATARRAIEALTLMRELSDGFRYIEEEKGTKDCPACGGRGIVRAPIPIEAPDEQHPINVSKDNFEMRDTECDLCSGTGIVPISTRGMMEVESPKDKVLIDLLEEHEECGRLIIWGGFTGTIDRIIKICHQQGWATLRVDGRGYVGTNNDGTIIDSDILLTAMDGSAKERSALAERYPRVAFVGHPKAGGMALTLTASPTEIFYSNDYSGEARMQAEDRFHRPGMDYNRGATIIDIIHLPTDQLVLDNLRQKKKLQDISMGELEQYINKENEHGTDGTSVR